MSKIVVNENNEITKLVIEEKNGKDGKDFTYDDFTPEQLEALKGDPGNDAIIQITKDELDALVLNSELDKTKKYLITDATASNIEIIISVKSSNIISENAEFPSENFDVVKYNYSEDKLYCYDYLGGVLRNESGTWNFLNDNAHKPKKLSTVSNLGSNGFRVNYSRDDYTKVVSMITSPDESYAGEFVTSGASAGLVFSDVLLYQNKTIGGYVYYNGSSWLDIGEGISSITFNAGTLTINHDSITGLYATAGLRDGDYIAELGSLGATNTKLKFKDYNGNTITTPNTSMRLYFSRKSNSIFSNSNIVNLSNIWIKGIMLKEY